MLRDAALDPRQRPRAISGTRVLKDPRDDHFSIAIGQTRRPCLCFRGPARLSVQINQRDGATDEARADGQAALELRSRLSPVPLLLKRETPYPVRQIEIVG